MTEYLGFLGEPTGYGAAAQRHVLALREVGHRVVPSALKEVGAGAYEDDWDGCPGAIRALRGREVGTAQNDDARVIHMPPPHYRFLRSAARHNVGFAAWETEMIPRSWTKHLREVDEVWVPSEFCARAFVRCTDRPVRVVPHPIALRPLPTTRWFPGIPDDVFLFGSVLQWSDRKNPDGLLRAFCRAFRGRSDVALAMKIGWRLAHEGGSILRTLHHLTLGFGPFRAPQVFIIGDELDEALMAQFYDRIDAYCSLHRAEGFGLCLAEAMAAGKPVIATAYSANLEFMDANCALLVDYRLVPAEQPLTPTWFDRSMHWAEPDSSFAIEALRTCVARPALRRRLGANARHRVASLLAPKRIGALMKRLLGGDAPTGD